MDSIPLFVRKFFVDFVETAIAALLALEIVLPADVEGAKRLAVTVGIAIATALVAAIRRATPGFLAWFAEKLHVNPSI